MKSKILFCVRSMDMAGGKERAITNIANALCEHHHIGILNLNGHTNSFYKLHPDIKLYALSALSFLGHPKSIKSSIQFFQGIKALAKFISREQPSLIIGNDFLINIQLILARWLSRSRALLVGWEHLTLEDPILVKRRSLLALRNFFYKKLATLIVITHSDEQYGTSRQIKTCLIPYPQSFSFEGTVDYEQKKILTIARLSYQKGLDFYMQLIASLKDRLNGWQFLLVGQEDDINMVTLNRLIQQYHIQSHITVMAPQQDVVSLYRQASIYLLTSRYEGLPITLIEAQSCGLPCISFDCKTGPSEIIANDLNGFIIPTFDVTEMANKVALLMGDPSLRRQMGHASKQAAQRYDEAEISKRWMSFIQQTLADK